MDIGVIENDEPRPRRTKCITRTRLRKVLKGPLERVVFLDIAGMGLTDFTHIEELGKLRTIVCSDNQFTGFLGLHHNRYLWNIFAPRCAISKLYALQEAYFSTLCFLDLRFNQILSFSDLIPLKEIQIVSLQLEGNPIYESPHYRTWTTWCLPLLWSLDGTYISAEERDAANHDIRSILKSEMKNSGVPELFMEPVDVSNIFLGKEIRLVTKLVQESRLQFERIHPRSTTGYSRVQDRARLTSIVDEYLNVISESVTVSTPSIKSIASTSAAFALLDNPPLRRLPANFNLDNFLTSLPSDLLIKIVFIYGAFALLPISFDMVSELLSFAMQRGKPDCLVKAVAFTASPFLSSLRRLFATSFVARLQPDHFSGQEELMREFPDMFMHLRDFGVTRMPRILTEESEYVLARNLMPAFNAIQPSDPGMARPVAVPFIPRNERRTILFTVYRLNLLCQLLVYQKDHLIKFKNPILYCSQGLLPRWFSTLTRCIEMVNGYVNPGGEEDLCVLGGNWIENDKCWLEKPFPVDLLLDQATGHVPPKPEPVPVREESVIKRIDFGKLKKEQKSPPISSLTPKMTHSVINSTRLDQSLPRTARQRMLLRAESREKTGIWKSSRLNVSQSGLRTRVGTVKRQKPSTRARTPSHADIVPIQERRREPKEVGIYALDSFWNKKFAVRPKSHKSSMDGFLPIEEGPRYEDLDPYTLMSNLPRIDGSDDINDVLRLKFIEEKNLVGKYGTVTKIIDMLQTKSLKSKQMEKAERDGTFLTTVCYLRLNRSNLKVEGQQSEVEEIEEVEEEDGVDWREIQQDVRGASTVFHPEFEDAVLRKSLNRKDVPPLAAKHYKKVKNWYYSADQSQFIVGTTKNEVGDQGGRISVFARPMTAHFSPNADIETYSSDRESEDAILTLEATRSNIQSRDSNFYVPSIDPARTGPLARQDDDPGCWGHVGKVLDHRQVQTTVPGTDEAAVYVEFFCRWDLANDRPPKYVWLREEDLLPAEIDAYKMQLVRRLDRVRKSRKQVSQLPPFSSVEILDKYEVDDDDSDSVEFVEK